MNDAARLPMTSSQPFRARLEEIKRAIIERGALRDALQPKLDALQSKLSELESASSERWELLKIGVEVALDDLEQTYPVSYTHLTLPTKRIV